MRGKDVYWAAIKRGAARVMVWVSTTQLGCQSSHRRLSEGSLLSMREFESQLLDCRSLFRNELLKALLLLVRLLQGLPKLEDVFLEFPC
jgi:hypothetical protein